MRPRRLEMTGFLAYRKPVKVDFTDADLFVLSGATGSGKSSVIDAMIFALYGTIPRLDDRRSVAPVINALSDRARVLFEFSIGEETFTAARLVERRARGATTPEAGLQRGEEPLASGADEVTAATTDLLGLTFEHFTKAVVLPQGAFADFLTDKPKDRQTLLRALLDLGLYERIKMMANERAAISRGRVESLEESLDKLDVPSTKEVEAARAELTRFETTREELPDRIRTIDTLAVSAEESTSRVSAGRDRVKSLETVAPPSDLVSLEERRSSASAAVDIAARTLEKRRNALVVLERRLAGYPAATDLTKWVSSRDRLEGLTRTKADLGLPALETELEEAEALVNESRRAVDGLMNAHAAHVLRDGLEIGETCPVCLQLVADLPAKDDEAVSSREQSHETHSRLESAARAVRDRLSEAHGEARQLDLSIAEETAQLDDAPEPDAVARDLAAVTELGDQIHQTTREVEHLTDGQTAALEQLHILATEASVSRDALLLARDAVAGEKPPSPGDDVVESWLEFDRWRDERLSVLRSEAKEHQQSLEDDTQALAIARSEFTEWLGSIVPAATEAPETDLALAIERLRAEIKAMSTDTERAVELKSQLEAEKTAVQVASALGTHLRSNNFEAWVMEEALEVLVEGANRLLGDLSAGAYSLQVADSQFEVVDHRNADLPRSTKSLSGGEVFLVSLSMALSMAGQLAELTDSSSPLESIFLDEGFGSLDQESLDIVASVLDDLAGRGRTVGIVTHIKDLSGRIPVRFEVTKGPDTSTIKRVIG